MLLFTLAMSLTILPFGQDNLALIIDLQCMETANNVTVSDYFTYASFRLPKFAYAFFVLPTENHPRMIMFLFIENTNILSSGVLLVKYLGEKHNTSRTTTRLHDNRTVTNNTRVRNEA